jgi:hypothetical protein
MTIEPGLPERDVDWNTIVAQWERRMLIRPDVVIDIAGRLLPPFQKVLLLHQWKKVWLRNERICGQPLCYVGRQGATVRFHPAIRCVVNKVHGPVLAGLDNMVDRLCPPLE